MKIRGTSDCESIVSLTNNDIRFQVKSDEGGRNLFPPLLSINVYTEKIQFPKIRNRYRWRMKLRRRGNLSRMNVYVKKLCVLVQLHGWNWKSCRVSGGYFFLLRGSRKLRANIAKRRESIADFALDTDENSEKRNHRLIPLEFCPRNARVVV